MQVIIYGATNPVSREIARQIGNAPPLTPFTERLRYVDSRWHSQIACIGMALGNALVRLARKAAQAYRTVVSEELQSLEEVGAQFDYCGRQAVWQDISHIVVAGLLLDIGVRDELLRSGLIRQQPENFWIWAFENGTCAKSAFGIKVWRGDEELAAVHELWHCASRRPLQLKVTAADIALLRSVSLFQHGHQASIADVVARQSALKLLFYKFLRLEGGSYRTNLPVLHAPAEQAVKVEIARVARRIVAESVQEAMEGAVQIYRRETDAGVPDLFRHAFARLLLEHAMDQVLEAHLLPEFPLMAGYPWGCWFSSGAGAR